MNINELDGGGSQSWKPENIGDKISGKIVKIERIAQTDFTTGEALFWSDGSPRLQTRVTLQTNESINGDDDGVRSVYLKGGRNFEAAEGKGKSGEVALAEAAKEAGSSTIDEHADLDIVMSGRSKPTTRGYQPAKLYQMRYTPPKASVSASELWGDDS